MYLLYIMMLLAQVRKHIPMITEDVSTENLYVLLGAELVHTHHEFP